MSAAVPRGRPRDAGEALAPAPSPAPRPGEREQSAAAKVGPPGGLGPASEAIQRRLIAETMGPLLPGPLEAIRTGRGRAFQRLELIGDSILEVVVHAHGIIAGPGCPYCAGRADRFTTDAHLSELAGSIQLGEWLDWNPTQRRLADLVEACVGATWTSGRWPQVVSFVAERLHPLDDPQRRRLLHGGAQVHPDAPSRAREILGAAILEAAASTAAFQRHPEADDGDLSRIKARMLSTEHVMGRSRDSAWVHKSLRRGHFDRDDVERLLADNLLGHGLASAVSLAWPLTT